MDSPKSLHQNSILVYYGAASLFSTLNPSGRSGDMRGTWIRKPRGETTAIFVHVILSSGETCWQNPNGAYWSDLVKNEKALKTWEFTSSEMGAKKSGVDVPTSSGDEINIQTGGDVAFFERLGKICCYQEFSGRGGGRPCHCQGRHPFQ